MSPAGYRARSGPPRTPGETGSPLVSVVIPTYNRTRLLPRAIRSILRQTYSNIEIVVVDDGSSEDVASVVRRFRDDRVRYVRHAVNKGLPAARNTGIREARGEVIAFLDDDDEWRADKLEKQVGLIGTHDAVACTASVNGFVLRPHRRRDITLHDLRKGPFSPSGLLTRTEVLRAVMFDESLAQGEDWDAYIRLAQRYSLACVPEPLVLYNEGQHARMTNQAKVLSLEELEGRAAVLHKHRRFLGEKWFRFHLADNFLSFLGSRKGKWACLRYAFRRCGLRAVTAVLALRTGRRVRRWFAVRAGR
jgi:glycosyltransferase involved in cell wall biosynthesis